MPMRPRKREVALFLLAFILPSAVLVDLGFRMVAQERVLAEARIADEWLSAVGRVRELLEIESLDPVVHDSLSMLLSRIEK